MTITSARTNLENTLRLVIAGLAEIGICPVKAYLPEQRKALWKEFDATARKWEAKFKSAAEKALDHDRREILAIVGEAKKAALREKASIDWKKILKQIEDYLEEAGEEFWRTTFVPLIEGIVIDQGEKWAGRLGIEFDVQNLRARSWFNDYTLRFSEPINDTTEREIAQIMARAQAEGSSIQKIQNQLDAMFEREITGKLPDDPEWEWFIDRVPPYRTEMIARTETIRASNNDTNELFKEWGVKRHEWLSTKDNRTRSYDAGDEFDHVEADGQVVPIDTPFIVSGEELEYPGDPAGSPGNTINCRCTIIPVIEEGEQLQEEGIQAFEGTRSEKEDYMMRESGFLDRGQDTDAGAALTKHSIVTELSSLTGIPYDDVNRFIRQWAMSSNDNDMRSLHIQQMAAEVFGGKLSEWQTTRLNALMAELQTPGADTNAAAYHPLLPDDHVKNLLKAMYDETQKQLLNSPEHLTDYLVVERGIKLDRSEYGDIEVGDTITMDGSVLESWTSNSRISHNFGRFSNPDQIGIVIEAKVPINMVIGSARTGFGCLSEYEFVILGNKSGTAKVIEVTK